MTTIYVVEAGMYSDRYIVGAFTSVDNADAVARAENARVIDVEVDSPLSAEHKRHLRPGERLYHVLMKADGNDVTTDVIFEDLDTSGRDRYSARYDRLMFRCWATSPEHAIKIANERRTGWLLGGKRLATTPNAHGWVEIEL